MSSPREAGVFEGEVRVGALRPDAALIEDWLVRRIAARLELAPATIDTEVPFAHLGLDSAAAVELSGELAEALGQPVDPTLVFEHVTIEALAAHLAATVASSAAAETRSAQSEEGAP